MLKKRNKHLIKLVFLCMTFTTSFANPVCTRIGAITECGRGTLSELHVAGKATLNGTTVLGKTDIAGMLDAYDVRLNKLKVSGKAFLLRGEIKADTKISGLLDARQSKFYQKLTISSDKTYLTESYTRDIQVNQGGEMQIVCVAHHTTIDGDIVFTSNHGVVVIDESSRIRGRIIGGYRKPSFLKHCEGEIKND